MLGIKGWFTLAGVVAVLAAATFAYVKVQSHFDYVEGLKADNSELTNRNEALNGQITELSQQNEKNKAIYRAQLDQAERARRLADQERQSAEQRANRYRSIRDAAKDADPQDRGPVSPVVQSTVDRLWPQGEGGS